MDIETRREASEIVPLVWRDETEIAGPAAVAVLAESPDSFALPDAGDHVDLMPIIEVLKGAVELVATCLTLYSTARTVFKDKADPDVDPNVQLDAKLDQATRDGTVTTEQAAELRRLILARA